MSSSSAPSVPTGDELRRLLAETAREYPQELVEGQLADLQRVAFHTELLIQHVGPRAVFADIGGGIGMFNLACARLGLRPTLVDDFRDPVNLAVGSGVLELHRRHGVEVISTDVVENPPEFPPNSLDAVTCFDSMEHWHRSPRVVFERMVRALREGGLFVLGCVNCVNLRKRITIPLGRGKWSSMDDWYENESFRGHVREPDVEDLIYIGRSIGLERMRVFGRNWIGLQSTPAVRLGTRAVDLLLRLRPSLCTNIYLIGFKPRRSA